MLGMLQFYVIFLLNFSALCFALTLINLILIAVLSKVNFRMVFVPNRFFLNFQELCVLLKRYVFSKLGCEPRELKLYLIFLFLPFFAMVGFIATQYFTLFAIFVSSVYFVFVWFRRARLVKRCLRKVHNFYLSDLGFKDYVKRDCRPALLSMISLKHAMENGMFIKRPNGLSYGLLRTPRRNAKVLADLDRKETEYLNTLCNSEEFWGLPEESRAEALNSLVFFFNGFRKHANILVTTEESKKLAVTFSLTSGGGLPDDKELSLVVGRALIQVSTELTPVCERWALGEVGKLQYAVSGFAALHEENDFNVLNPTDEHLNKKFFDESNLESIDRIVSSYRDVTKELIRFEEKPEYRLDIITDFNSDTKVVVPTSFGILASAINP